jgi:hypothetical protein
MPAYYIAEHIITDPAAFEEYRVETLRRLEQEQRDFHDFLARLRIAKDRAEFEQFMAERRGRAEMPLSPA